MCFGSVEVFVANRCSYDRVRLVQKTGEETRDRWHKTDWEKVAKDPESVSFRREDWIHEHDSEKYANDNFDAISKRISEPETVDGTSLLSAAPAPVAV